jgi:uncharacterized protein (TIGR03083 family)
MRSLEPLLWRLSHVKNDYKPGMEQEAGHSWFFDALSREVAQFGAVLTAGDLTASVKSCPGWDVARLATHLAAVHRRAKNAVMDQKLHNDPTTPLRGRQQMVDWYVESAELLLAALRHASPSMPCPAFRAGPHTAEFWLHRQTHETAVHRYDAEQATGQEPLLDPTLSAYGVHEVLDVFVPYQVERGHLNEKLAPLTLHSTDTGHRWQLGGGRPIATVCGPAATILLVLWRRMSPANLDVEGDWEAARDTLRSPLTP